MTNNEVVKSILGRVLSQEIAHQEIWKKQDTEKYGIDSDRDALIKEIKEWMQENDIAFNRGFYEQVLYEEFYK